MVTTAPTTSKRLESGYTRTTELLVSLMFQSFTQSLASPGGKCLKRNTRLAGFLALTIALVTALPVTSAHAQATKPYDSQLLRLSEILGAIHYLRELCGAGEGQLWRKQMRELLKAEGSSALRRARLSRSFNEGYRSYSRTYKICTASAKTAVERFLTERYRNRGKTH